MRVGVRELRNNLSRSLARVREGEEVVVTQRGRAIARVLPIGGKRTIDRLIREGKVTPAKTSKRFRPKPTRTKGPVSDLVAQQRR